ncbi:protein Jade-1-like isoform X2 [Leucoraja erinacea]|uniref:protein Jade-1-like isoform X2 n=1 Tax=Leucoraja erinaceus TaxID=7782 RepID=UPI002454C0AB|nr:protein Jade-1-like isoform X2 [Leucoraja erinacea]
MLLKITALREIRCIRSGTLASFVPEIEKTMKRNRLPSSSDDSDDNDSHSTSWSQHSRSQHRRSSTSRHKDRKPSEVYRTDLITAMKLHDSHQLSSDEYYILADSWRQEWEKGVQVPVSPDSVPQASVRVTDEKNKAVIFSRPRKYIHSSGSEPPELGYVDIRTLADSVCRYDLDDMDVAWLELLNEEFRGMGMAELDEFTMERVMEDLERRCDDNMNHAIETEEGLGIEYDEDVVCDVCQSPDGEDGNEMVFCDKCNICVHQACYGILKVPEGSWLCRTCALGVQPKCLLCPKKGGAMKPTRSGTKWVHVSCALWIPEVSIGCPEKMEPITKISHVPASRWALVCSLCTEKTGACIQCSVKNCRTAFHVTCAFDRSLEMKTILAENDEVKFKSYCPKHSSKEPGEGTKDYSTTEMEEKPTIVESALDSMDQTQAEAERISLRKQKLQQLEDEFYNFVSISEVSQHLKLSEELVDFIYQYWKGKRKSNLNKPLFTPKKDEEDNLAKQEQDVLFRRLQLFTHLRQDLERVRNLTYMVSRREKIKRSICRVQEQIFHHQMKLLEEERISGVPSAFPSSDALFLGWLAQSHPVSNTGGLQWKLNRELETSQHPDKVWRERSSRLSGRMQSHTESAKQSLLKQSNRSSECKNTPNLHRVREDYSSPSLLLPYDMIRGEVRGNTCERNDGLTTTDHRKKTDVSRRSTGGKTESRERACSKRDKSYMSADLTLRQSENKRALCATVCKVPSVSIRRLSGDGSHMHTKFNGTLSKVACNQSAVPPGPQVPTTPTSPVKNWGGFKIPKKGERKQHEERPEACRQISETTQYQRTSPKERTKVRLLPDSENDGYSPDVEMSDSETESDNCKPQRLNSNSEQEVWDRYYSKKHPGLLIWGCGVGVRP